MFTPQCSIDPDADRELSAYFATTEPWERWFNVIAPAKAPIAKLCEDLHRLRDIHQQPIEE